MTEREAFVALQAENARLVALLESHGIAWRATPAAASQPALTAPVQVPVPEAQRPSLSTAEKVTLFRRLFRGRTDVYPVRWEGKTSGKSGYAPACANEWRAGVCEDLPHWYWTGATDMACLRDAIEQTLTHGYANHIQRLMVTGLYALMLGVQPRQVHAWYLAVYVDAVEWVELPNTLGMSQYADGGLMGSKPYVATGKYIERMSPHCKGCRYDPAQRSGDSACLFTTLYWDFLMRHEATLAKNPRMALQVKNLARMNATQRQDVVARAAAIRRGEVGELRVVPPWLSPSRPRCPRRRPASPRFGPAAYARTGRLLCAEFGNPHQAWRAGRDDRPHVISIRERAESIACTAGRRRRCAVE